MECPECGTDSSISRTIHIPPGTLGAERIWRRRRCHKGHKFYTVESVTRFTPRQLTRKIRIKGVIGGTAEMEVN